MEHKPKLCPDCKERYVKITNGFYSARCIPCTFKYNNTVGRDKYKKPHKILSPKKCAKCECVFDPHCHLQKYCNNPCTSGKSNKEKWLDAKERPKPLDSNIVAYGFFRKKYGVNKKFKVCRG